MSACARQKTDEPKQRSAFEELAAFALVIVSEDQTDTWDLTVKNPLGSRTRKKKIRVKGRVNNQVYCGSDLTTLIF